VLLLVRPLFLLYNLRQPLGFTPLTSSLFLTQLGYNSVRNYGPMTHNFVCKDFLVSKQIHLSTFYLHSWYWYVRFECEVFVMVLFATYKFSLGDFHFHVWEWYGGNQSYAKLNSEAECSYSLFLVILWYMPPLTRDVGILCWLFFFGHNFFSAATIVENVYIQCFIIHGHCSGLHLLWNWSILIVNLVMPLPLLLSCSLTTF
jgi:hypothetical protein